MYCITNKVVNILNETNYKIGWVGKEKPPNHYILCNSKDNIFYKEKYYSELTFQYWFWKNLLDTGNPNWIGFCQKRRFWLKKNSNLELKKTFNFINDHLNKPDPEWDTFDAIICNSINVNKVKKIKLLKRGFRSIIKNPSIFFNEEKQNLALHFDMHHGYGILEKASKELKEGDRDEFLDYVSNNSVLNPHIMFIAKKKILNKWFIDCFEWLFKCEKLFGFDNLTGYDKKRLYAFLAERYLSFWFHKYARPIAWHWTFYDIEKEEI